MTNLAQQQGELIKKAKAYFWEKESLPAQTIEIAKGIVIGKGNITVIAGPCAIESEEQILTTAYAVKEAGAQILRGGAFKPRTSPYTFQGLGREALLWLKKAGDLTGLPIITEILDQDDLELVCEYSDLIQVGARNSQNYALLKKLGKIQKPVVLKRGFMMTIDELLLAAEYILSGGNHSVVLCERGIRTFETSTRNTLDISAVPILKQKTHLPVFVDPSHAAGQWRLVEPLALASLAAGADGLMVEVHPQPDAALSDGPQSLNLQSFTRLMQRLKAWSAFINKEHDFMTC